MSQPASTFHGSKFARLFVTPTGTGATATELPLMSATVNPGQADRLRFRHSLSLGGTDVDTGMKTEPTLEFVIEKDYANDPFGTTLNMKGGTILAEVDLYEYDPAGAATPAGIHHKFLVFQLEQTVTSVNVEGKIGLRFTGCCSTRNYSYLIS